MLSVGSQKNAAIICLYSINRPVFTTETECVYCAVRANARVQPQFNPPDICVGKSGTGTGFSPTASVFPCQYHYIHAPYCPTFIYMFLLREVQAGETCESSQHATLFSKSGGIGLQRTTTLSLKCHSI
jgi:hypothetical protein